jgi:hypothetical protein
MQKALLELLRRNIISVAQFADAAWDASLVGRHVRSWDAS